MQKRTIWMLYSRGDDHPLSVYVEVMHSRPDGLQGRKTRIPGVKRRDVEICVAQVNDEPNIDLVALHIAFIREMVNAGEIPAESYSEIRVGG